MNLNMSENIMDNMTDITTTRKLSAKEAADYVNVSKRTILLYMNEDLNLEPIREGKRIYYIWPSDWLERKKKDIEGLRCQKDIKSTDGHPNGLRIDSHESIHELLTELRESHKNEIKSLHEQLMSVTRECDTLRTNNMTLNRELENRATQIQKYREAKKKRIWEFWKK